MNIYSPAGTKVVYMDANGFDADLVHARLYLAKGDVLTVKRIQIDNWCSWVEFDEHPGKTFNTVHFVEAPAHE